MRYYFNIIEMTTNGENRTVPTAFTDKNSAMAKYHSKVGTDISAESVIGYVATVFDSEGNIYVMEKWGTMETPTSES